jgi:hypothetical protein
MSKNIILEIQASFVREAISSPLLLADLASMEKYISESYQGRSLIELLQNADDALSTKFIIERVNKTTYIIANNGREFNDDDVISICRSGVSTKQRKSSFIGFRGIGFKSIVNYAKCVHIISGEMKFTFSKELSQKLVNGSHNVPLIRIPHEFIEDKYNAYLEELWNKGFSTIFIFEVDSDKLSTEMSIFNSTSMLFLNRIQEISFSYDNHSNIYKIGRETINNNLVVASINSEDQNNRWLILNDANKCSVAFQIDSNNQVIKIDNDEAVIHSFMPTKEFTNLPLKMNGDFSTDPSRTKVIIDDETLLAIKYCVMIIVDLLIKIIKEENDPNFVVRLLSDVNKDELASFRGKKVGDYIFEELQYTLLEKLPKLVAKDYENRICLQPAWIEEKDFINICVKNKILGISERLERKIPNLLVFLKKMGFEEMSLKLIVLESRNLEYSLESRAKIFAELIRTYRFGFNEDERDLITNSKLLEFENGCKSISSSKSSDKLLPTFYATMCNLVDDEKDLQWMLKKFNLYDYSTGTFNISDNATMKNNVNSEFDSKIEIYDSSDLDSLLFNQRENSTYSRPVTFRERPSFQKWKSVEENVALFFEKMVNVVKVTDVSKSNLGYDLEVQWKDKINYVEIKSVQNLGDPFTMTNNEYSTAVQFGDKYELAIVEQLESTLKICLIQNPNKMLTLFKRVTRWEWVCNEYSGILIDTNISA